MATRECYIAMLEMEDHQQTMCIGEQRTMVEPIEELEEAILDESRPGRTTRMGTFGQPNNMSRPGRLPKDESRHIRVEPRRHAWDRSVNNSPQTKC